MTVTGNLKISHILWIIAGFAVLALGLNMVYSVSTMKRVLNEEKQLKTNRGAPNGFSDRRFSASKRTGKKTLP